MEKNLPSIRPEMKMKELLRGAGTGAASVDKRIVYPQGKAPEYHCKRCESELSDSLVCPFCATKDVEASTIERFKRAVYNLF